jgi:hypothetical protein
MLQESLCLVAVFYSAALSLAFPLLGIPALIILLLAFVAVRYTVHYVHALTIGGPSGGQPTLWLVSHFGAFICLTPLVYGLALASRRLLSYAAGTFAPPKRSVDAQTDDSSCSRVNRDAGRRPLVAPGD